MHSLLHHNYSSLKSLIIYMYNLQQKLPIYGSFDVKCFSCSNEYVLAVFKKQRVLSKKFSPKR